MVLKERYFLWRVKMWERRRRDILMVFLLEVRK